MIIWTEETAVMGIHEFILIYLHVQATECAK